MPGRRSTMLNRPWSSVTAVRTFSMRAGLAAPTVTPGSTAPDASRAAPAMPAGDNCAAATLATSIADTRTTDTRTPNRARGITPPLSPGPRSQGIAGSAFARHRCSAGPGPRTSWQQWFLPGRQLLIEHGEEHVLARVRRHDVHDEVGQVLLAERRPGARVGVGADVVAADQLAAELNQDRFLVGQAARRCVATDGVDRRGR